MLSIFLVELIKFFLSVLGFNHPGWLGYLFNGISTFMVFLNTKAIPVDEQ